MEEKRNKRPEDTPFKQQRLKAWQPLLTPQWVIGSFLLIGCVFLPVGIAIYTESNKVVEYRERYDQKVGVNNASTYVVINIDKDMSAPVYFYYELTNFFQNHRRYVKSRSDTQLRGVSLDSDLSLCDPVSTGKDNKTLVPCGLIAASFFNDEFEQPRFRGNTLVDWTGDGIAWKSDVADKFKKLPLTADYTSTTDRGVVLDITSEDFIVWMRTAGLPTFRKLKKIITTDLKSGDVLNITIHSNYDVASFDGEKAIVLSTTSWLGGRNPFLGVAYIVVGVLCLVLAIGFYAKHKISPRRAGDLSHFHWSHGGSMGFISQSSEM